MPARFLSVCAVLLALSSVTIATIATAANIATAAIPGAIPLEAGTYVLDGAGKTCEDVANAGTVYFDGANLIGPHDHASHSVVKSVSADGATYILETRFTAYTMDGKQERLARADMLKIGSTTSFRLIDENTHVDRGGFHRCGPMPKLV